MALDTAYNYRGFTSHRRLSAVASDLLDEFDVSTKVGFFPGDGDVPVHSLDTVRLCDAIDESANTLGVVPEVVLLHNPERSMPGNDRAAELDQLTAACLVLDGAVTSGLCRSWGWSSWDPRALAAALPDAAAASPIPAPRVLMVRAGLLVGADVLDAGEHLATMFGLDTAARWGMSPFGGEVERAVWDRIDPRSFLGAHQQASVAQALLRLAFDLPQVGRIALGTDNPDHLDDAITATSLAVDEVRTERYRVLLRGAKVRTVSP
ncbi:aldo/keto reductase [Amycolatopsis carbonis]|uniref:Aldo/keto reductase n=1 Tax=Amycolatopsis carbonis TaxID=715471 RepID=A0A9Y2IB51_9PSEU|nr:aldo/keto reductase [Amycolatopsis sp. 2-15]WIX76036.1 aldo/keto reductase [Amycolatopsis sp. 2-15]